jgi:hypothetical protein
MMKAATSASTMWFAVVETYRRAFRPPFEIPIALITNAVLVTLAWFLVPPRVHDWLFSIPGPLAFPVIMASWMLGDTPSTNVAALDTTKTLSVLEDAAAFRTCLLARSVVLTSLVGVPTAVIALVIGLQGQPAIKVVATCFVLAILPFGILPIAAWVGILLPYHPKKLRWRWENRSDWRRIARWVLLLLVPFVIVPTVATMIISPSLALARGLFGAPHPPLTDAKFVLVALSICATALLAGWLGLWVAGRLRIRRHDQLVGYLRDPAVG